MPTRQDILSAALEAVTQRQPNYGSPEDNFLRIARRWNTHLINRYGLVIGDIIQLDEFDVALMLDDLKSARLENNPQHLDSWIDKAGYAACGGSLIEDPQ